MIWCYAFFTNNKCVQDVKIMLYKRDVIKCYICMKIVKFRISVLNYPFAMSSLFVTYDRSVVYYESLAFQIINLYVIYYIYSFIVIILTTTATTFNVVIIICNY